MNDATISRNYAETLLILAKKDGHEEQWGNLIDTIGVAMREDRTLKTFLESPKIAASQKIEILARALSKRVPPLFLRFLETVVTKRRQMLIPVIASEYRALIDESEDRVHANVTVAREADEKTQKLIADRLGDVFNKTVIPHLTVDSRIIGGLVVRVGDTVMDGSVRRKLGVLRHRMLST